MPLFSRPPQAARDALRDFKNAFDAEDWPVAEDALQRVLTAVPAEDHEPEWLYNLALVHKFRRDWPKALEVGRRAVRGLAKDREEPAFWNLGIAATVEGDWATAREAWRGYGISLPDGEGPIEDDFGPTCVRIDTPDGQEVVWARRLCPTRARVLNVPLSPARRFGDVVIHDGVPNGERFLGDQAVPVFDELVVVSPGPFPSLAVRVVVETGDDGRALVEAFDAAGYAAEPTSTVRQLCACCSEGSVAPEHRPVEGEQPVLLAAPREAAVELLDAWRDARPGARGWGHLTG